VKNAIYLGQVAGIKIFVHWTFAILIGWIAFTHLSGGAAGILWSVLFILIIFGCVVLHELGHALAAKRYHIKTKDITLYPIGGIAQLESLPEKPKEELIVALAGPAVNFIIAALLLPFVNFTILQNAKDMANVNAQNFWPLLVTVNVWLAIFNLVPAFPMDGGRVLRALLAFKMSRVAATLVAARIGQAIAFGFIFFGFSINPFLVFIGLFILLGAQTELSYVGAQSLLQGHSIRELTMRNVPLLNGDAPISDAVHELLTTQNKDFLVMDNSLPVGTLGREEIIRAITEKGQSIKIEEAMNKDILYLPESLSISEAWLKLQQVKKTMALVTKENRFVGAVDSETIAEFILIKDAEQKSA
jgi:Zn-dependent protease/CBS domain-containing protein